MKNIEKKMCCGCELCVTLCPKGVLEMKKDAEGFFYPSVLKIDDCVSCGTCTKKCPVKGDSQHFVVQNINAWGGYFKDKNYLRKSASGGIATALSEIIIQQNGIVYGASYTNDLRGVMYEKIENEQFLYKLKGSKYTQARKKGIYASVLHDLEQRRKVLFIGLPCDVYALKLFVKKDYDNLITCDLICHGPTSENVLNDYLQFVLEGRGITPVSINTRYKLRASKPPCIRVMFSDGTDDCRELYKSEYGMAFQVMKRPYCNHCAFKGNHRASDVTIGDYHAVQYHSLVYNELGVSSAITHTKKGEELLSKIDRHRFCIEEISMESAMNNRAYYTAIARQPTRNRFVNIYLKKGLVNACNDKLIILGEHIRREKNKLRVYSKYAINIAVKHLRRYGIRL